MRMSEPTGIPITNGFSNNGFSSNGFSSPPPLPGLNNNSSSNNTSPANVFAQMKSGTFAKDDAPNNNGEFLLFIIINLGYGLLNWILSFSLFVASLELES